MPSDCGHVSPWKKVIGILGGLGPHAHIEFERLLLEEATRGLGRPARDQDYPPWVLSSLPQTPDRTEALTGLSDSPLPALVTSARRLEGQADFLVIPCNTAHAFLEELRSAVSIPVLDMVRETVQEAATRDGAGATVGLLATTGTLRSGLYARSAAGSLRLLSLLDLPDGERLQEEWVMAPIYGPLQRGVRAGGGIKSGAHREPRSRERLARPLRRAVACLGDAGARRVITACTEIPLVLGRESLGGVPLLDPMQVAARACVQIALGRRPLAD